MPGERNHVSTHRSRVARLFTPGSRSAVAIIAPKHTPKRYPKMMTAALPPAPAPPPPKPSLQIQIPVVPSHSPPSPSSRTMLARKGKMLSPPVRSLPEQKNFVSCSECFENSLYRLCRPARSEGDVRSAAGVGGCCVLGPCAQSGSIPDLDLARGCSAALEPKSLVKRVRMDNSGSFILPPVLPPAGRYDERISEPEPGPDDSMDWCRMWDGPETGSC